MTYPLGEIPDEAWHMPQERYKVSVEWQVDHPRMLLVQGSNDGLRDNDRSEAWNEELVQPVLRDGNSGEEPGQNMASEDEGSANSGGLVLVVKFIPERFVEGNKGRLGRIVVGYHNGRGVRNTRK